jgi:hypothetical protein
MIPLPDNRVMFALLLLAVLLAVCVLAGFYGADSRRDEYRRNHPNLR